MFTHKKPAVILFSFKKASQITVRVWNWKEWNVGKMIITLIPSKEPVSSSAGLWISWDKSWCSSIAFLKLLTRLIIFDKNSLSAVCQKKKTSLLSLKLSNINGRKTPPLNTIAVKTLKRGKIPLTDKASQYHRWSRGWSAPHLAPPQPQRYRFRQSKMPMKTLRQRHQCTVMHMKTGKGKRKGTTVMRREHSQSWKLIC